MRDDHKYKNTLFKVESGLDNFKAEGCVKEFKVDLCDRKEISAFITHWHYSKNINGLTIDYCFKLSDIRNRLIGAMIYGKLGMAGVWKKHSQTETGITELKRLCCIDDTPKNTESYFIGNTLRWLKKNTTIKTVISYADQTFGHEGTIYKASNFKHIGLTMPGKVIIYNGERYHDKTVRTKHNGELKSFAKKMAERLKTGEAKLIDTLPKHIFLYNL